MKHFKELRKQPCLACDQDGPSDVAHIKSKGSGGKDTIDDVIPLCRHCHHLSHHLGWAKFLTMFESVRKRLLDMGWEIREEFGLKKLRRV
jgi:hypothetical protein